MMIMIHILSIMFKRFLEKTEKFSLEKYAYSVSFQCQTFDFELTPFIDQLFEYEKTFPPR